MNIFEAYDIIGELGDAIVKNNSGFISDSIYPYTKQESYDAFTLLIGHIVSFGTMTKEEFDSIYINIGQVENIVPHSLYRQQREAESLIEKAKSPMYRFFHKEKIRVAQNLSNQFLMQFGSNWGHSVNKIQGFDYADLVHSINALFEKYESIPYAELVGIVYSFTSQKEPTELESRVFRPFSELMRLSNSEFNNLTDPLEYGLKSIIMKNKGFIRNCYEKQIRDKERMNSEGR